MKVCPGIEYILMTADTDSERLSVAVIIKRYLKYSETAEQPLNNFIQQTNYNVVDQSPNSLKTMRNMPLSLNSIPSQLPEAQNRRDP